MDIAAWLRDLGLERYEQAFRDNDVDVDLLSDLMEVDLEKLGVASLGHRKILLRAIENLRPPGVQPAAGRTTTADEPLPVPSTPAARSEAERRQLTVLFCDLVGSTELSARLDPEDMGAVIRRYQECCADVVRRWDGHVAKYMGDGILVYFGYPQAHEDDTERAVRSALDLAKEVAQLPPSDGASLAARVGIATGLVMVGDLIGKGAAQEQPVVGETPNLAARLQGVAEPGSVVIAEGTWRLLGALFEYADLGSHDLKGFAEPIQAWRVLGESGAESRFEALHGHQLTALVGREHEIGLLVDRWERAKEGEGQVVLLSGEPGIGKSRIVRALRERLTNQPHTPLSHYCSPYHTNSALHPVIGLLERAAGFARDDGAEIRLDKLEALLARGTEALGEVVPLVAALLEIETDERYPPLALSPQRQKQRTLEVLVDQVEGLAAEQSVLAIYEDVHWVDPTTLEVLSLLIERMQRLPLLVLITFRPEFSAPWTGHAHVMQLSLSRLTRRHGQALIEEVTRGQALPDDVLDQIIARADGVPLFIEELTKTVLETGETTIPASLHDPLMSRLDRLPEVKEVAQIASCIGREFHYGLLASISDSSDLDLQTALARLTSAELVFQRGEPPNSQYIFKHALVRDAAHGSLLKQTARQIHARIAAALVDQASDNANLPSDLVATHLLAAGCERDALPHMLAAAKLASQRYAYPEALNWLTGMQSAIKHLGHDEQLRRLEMDLYVTLTPILMTVRGYTDAETVAIAERAVQLGTELEDYDRLLPMLFARLSGYSAASEIHPALKIAERIREIGTERLNLIAKVVGHRTVGFCRLWMGHLETASESLTCAIDLSHDLPEVEYHRQFGQDPTITAKILLAYAKHLRGDLDAGMALAREAQEQANLLGHPLTNAYVTMHRCHIIADRLDFDELIETGVLLESICKDYGISQFEKLGPFFAIWASIMSGEHDVSCHNLEVLLEDHKSRGIHLLMPHYLRMQSTALICGGHFEKAKQCLDEAFEIVAKLGERWVEPELLRCRASLILHQASDETHVIERHLKESCQVAAAQGAKLSQLRAARDLARLWADNAERQKAYDMLAPIYGSFTESFDTADLKNAKALLDELA